MKMKEQRAVKPCARTFKTEKTFTSKCPSLAESSWHSFHGQMACSSTTVVIAISFDKCDHLREAKRIIVSVPGECSLKELFEKHHSAVTPAEDYILKTFTSLGVAGDFEVDNQSMTIDDLTRVFSEIKCLRFCCSKVAAAFSNDDGKDQRDAFKVLMAGGRARAFVPKKSSRFVRYNWTFHESPWNVFYLY